MMVPAISSQVVDLNGSVEAGHGSGIGIHLEAEFGAIVAIPHDFVKELAFLHLAFCLAGLRVGSNCQIKLRLPAIYRYSTDVARDALALVAERDDVCPDQVSGTRDVLAEQHRFERLSQIVRGTHFADLTNLCQELIVLQRVQRILVLQFRNHQIQKRVQV
ncbi:hypothetical protein N9N28_13075 [Rubripirellula amarantea]|nr:hypothetical protein [Rubripirellula amarantea]